MYQGESRSVKFVLVKVFSSLLTIELTFLQAISSISGNKMSKFFTGSITQKTGG